MLKVIDGLRTCYNNAAHNCTPDVPSQSVTNNNIAGVGIDMANFAELVVVGLCSGITGSGVGSIIVQESADNTAFTNVTNAAMSFNTANTVRVHSVDWRKPERKRYARVLAGNTTNAATVAAITLRLSPENVISLANNAGQVDA